MGSPLLERLDQRLVAAEQVEGDEDRGFDVRAVVKTVDGFSRWLEEDVPRAELAHGPAILLERDQAAFHVPGDRAGMEVRAGRLAGRELHPVRLHPVGRGVHRDDGIVYVDITMRAGRTDEQKKALYAKIAELAGKYADTEPRNVFVAIHENQFADWSFGNGVAQYLERAQ